MLGQIIRRSERIWVVRMIMAQGGTRSKVVHGTRQDAQAYLDGVQREVEPRKRMEPSAVRLGAFLERWLEEVARPKIRGVSYKNYRELLKLYVVEQLGGLLLGELTTFQLQSHYSRLRELQVNGTTLKRLHAMITSGLDQAVGWGLLESNPARSVNGARLRQQPQEEQVEHPLALDLALSTGLRPREYLALLWKDVDLERGVMVVERTLLRIRKGGWRFEPAFADGGQRTIALSHGLLEKLRALRVAQPAIDPDYPDFVFRGVSGEPIRPIQLKRQTLRRALERAQLDPSLRICG